jgi:predicted metal-dependent enzyme (double-stranded beta helix superfamily)
MEATPASIGRNAVMAYDLEQFCKDGRAALQQGPLETALQTIAADLRKLLANADFVRATFNDETPVGKRELFHDAATDFYVLAHVQAPGKAGAPHSHGNSWAIYGNARGFTEMTEYKRVNPESEEAVTLAVSDKYRVSAGESRGYGPGKIHSTAHPEKAWVVRITGTDLDHLPRYHFKKSRDRLLESA